MPYGTYGRVSGGDVCRAGSALMAVQESGESRRGVRTDGDLFDDADPGASDAGEVYELYVDPSAQRAGGGGRLLDAAEAWFPTVGYERAELSTLATNPAAQAFYRARGWEPTGRVTPVDLGVVAFDEVRFASRLGADRS